MSSLDYAGAMVHALEQEMEHDPRVFVYGEGINDTGVNDAPGKP